VHWYCKECDSGVGKILKAFVILQQKQETLEERRGKLENEVGEMKMKMQKDETKSEKRLKRFVENERQKNLKRMKNFWMKG
jgi:uncharacterized protein YlxW (UPF0749 family)